MQAIHNNMRVEEETWGEAFREVRGSTWEIVCLLWSRFMVSVRFIRHIFHLVTMTLAASLVVFCLVRFFFPFDF